MKYSALKPHLKQSYLSNLLTPVNLFKASKVWTTSLLIFGTSFGFSITSLAADCSYTETSIPSVADLVSRIKDPSCNIKNIDGVIAILPERMKFDFAMFYQSQSLQGPHTPDYLNPRVIMQTNQDGRGFYLAFNDKHVGSNALEMAEVNHSAKDPNKIFQLFEIEFPQESSNTLSWEQVQKQVKVSDPNPAKCVTCHGQPARPVFQGYPIWTGGYGSFHLSVNSNEEKGLTSFINSVDSKSRYRHLKLKGQDSEASYQTIAESLLTGQNNIRLNSELFRTNAVKIARTLNQTPDYAKYRYAIAGALLDCSSYASFFPKNLAERLESNLNLRFGLLKKYNKDKQDRILQHLISAGELQFGNLFDLNGHANSMQEGPSLESFNEQRTVRELSKEIKTYSNSSDIFYALAIDTLAIQGQQRSNSNPIKLRYVMESRNIDIKNWFLDLKQPSYRMMDGVGGGDQIFWELLHLDPAFSELSSEYRKISEYDSNGKDEFVVKACAQLKQKSLVALTAKSESQVSTEKTIANSVSNGVLPSVFANVCAKCHDKSSSDYRIPFSNHEEMQKWLSKEGNAAKIKNRISAPEPFQMPPSRKLSDREIELINRYLDSK